MAITLSPRGSASASDRLPRPLLGALLAAILLASAGSGALGQGIKLSNPATSSQPAATPAPEIAPDSPRSSLAAFFDLCRSGRYEEASRYLEPGEAGRAGGAALARKLKAVLDRDLWIDLSKVSAAPDGDRNDGLSSDTEELGTIPSASGKREPVRLIRTEREGETTWVFTRGTVSRIELWWSRLPDRSLREAIPEPLQRPGPKELLWWQWLAILVLSPALWFGGRCLGWVTRKALVRLLKRSGGGGWDDAALRPLQRPIAFGWAVVLASLGIPLLALYVPAGAFARQVVTAAAIVALFWTLYVLVFVLRQTLAGSEWSRTHPAAPSLLSLGFRATQVALFTIGLLSALSALGIPAGSILAGLGIGGLAVALAAQKTVENLFGSVSLGIDQPLQVGDFVKVGDVQGTVEAIGLRSTRIRTPDRTIVTIPNGKLADLQIETFAVRDRFLLGITLGIGYGATASQIRRVVAAVEESLLAHPKVWRDGLSVSFRELGTTALNIEVVAWFATTDLGEFRGIRQEVLLEFMEIVESQGLRFAFPARTVHLVDDRRTPDAGKALSDPA